MRMSESMKLNKQRTTLTEAPFDGSSFSLPDDIKDLLDKGDYARAYNMVKDEYQYTRNYPDRVPNRDMDAILNEFALDELGV